jgi:hypothetical protein
MAVPLSQQGFTTNRIELADSGLRTTRALDDGFVFENLDVFPSPSTFVID